MNESASNEGRTRGEGAAAWRAGAIGSIAGIAVGGIVHGLLPAGALWLRAGASGGAAAIAGGLIAWVVLRRLLRAPA